MYDDPIPTPRPSLHRSGTTASANSANSAISATATSIIPSTLSSLTSSYDGDPYTGPRPYSTLLLSPHPTYLPATAATGITTPAFHRTHYCLPAPPRWPHDARPVELPASPITSIPGAEGARNGNAGGGGVGPGMAVVDTMTAMMAMTSGWIGQFGGFGHGWMSLLEPGRGRERELGRQQQQRRVLFRPNAVATTLPAGWQKNLRVGFRTHVASTTAAYHDAPARASWAAESEGWWRRLESAEQLVGKEVVMMDMQTMDLHMQRRRALLAPETEGKEAVGATGAGDGESEVEEEEDEHEHGKAGWAAGKCSWCGRDVVMREGREKWWKVKIEEWDIWW